MTESQPQGVFSDKESFFDRTAATPYPNLNEAGECLYEHRPLVCRTFGLPLRKGDRHIGDVCELNFTEASNDERNAAAWDLKWEDALIHHSGGDRAHRAPPRLVVMRFTF